MSDLTASGLGAIPLHWSGVGFFAMACAVLGCRRLLSPAATWLSFIALASTGVVLVVLGVWPAHGGVVPSVVRVCAVLTLAWTVCGSVAPRRGGDGGVEPSVDPPDILFRFIQRCALMSGVTVVSLLSVVLSMRVIHVSMDLMRVYPSISAPAYGFGAEGLWSLGLVTLSCAVALWDRRDRRFGACLLWVVAVTVCWACLVAPTLRPTASGGLRRTASTLVLTAALSAVPALLLLLTGWIDRRQRNRTEVNLTNQKAVAPCRWPGLTLSAAVISMAVILLVCYHLAVPFAVGGGFRVVALVITASSALAACASFALLTREWNAHLAEAAMGLTSMALCGLATAALPAQPVALAERYPLVFTAIIIGLAASTGLWTWVGDVWCRRAGANDPEAVSAKLAPYAKRFAFLSAALALVVGAVMATWPRRTGIAPTDDSFGRVAAGFAANLFLLVVMLWCSRRLRKTTFHLLTVLAVVLAAGFLIVRMLPFMSSIE